MTRMSFVLLGLQSAASGTGGPRHQLPRASMALGKKCQLIWQMVSHCHLKGPADSRSFAHRYVEVPIVLHNSAEYGEQTDLLADKVTDIRPIHQL